MALRSQNDDYLHNFRFTAEAIDENGSNRFALSGASPPGPSSGFTTVTIPEVTVEVAEYKEGTDIWKKKFPGPPSVNDLTFARGVARTDSSLWSWMRVVTEGSGTYRATILLKMFHRTESLVREFPAQGIENLVQIPAGVNAIGFHLYNAFPIRFKAGTDLDANSADVSIAELDVAFESFEIEYLA